MLWRMLIFLFWQAKDLVGFKLKLCFQRHFGCDTFAMLFISVTDVCHSVWHPGLGGNLTITLALRIFYMLLVISCTLHSSGASPGAHRPLFPNIPTVPKHSNCSRTLPGILGATAENTSCREEGFFN